MKMLRRRLFFALAYICLLTLGACQNICGKVRKEVLTIGHIRNPGDMMDGCGCALQFPVDRNYNSSGVVFVADETGAGLMNINGRDTRLQIVYSSLRDRTERELKRGDRFSATFVGGGNDVKINARVTDTCGDARECKLVYVDANVTVTRNRLVRNFTGVGACGCR